MEIFGGLCSFVIDRNVCDSLHLSWCFSSIFHLLLSPHLPQLTAVVLLMWCSVMLQRPRIPCLTPHNRLMWILWAQYWNKTKVLSDLGLFKPQVVPSHFAQLLLLCELCVGKRWKQLGLFQQHKPSADAVPLWCKPRECFLCRMSKGKTWLTWKHLTFNQTIFFAFGVVWVSVEFETKNILIYFNEKADGWSGSSITAADCWLSWHLGSEIITSRKCITYTKWLNE